jgi:hypothetical protein
MQRTMVGALHVPVCHAHMCFSHCTNADASACASASTCYCKLMSRIHNGGAELAQRHPEVPRLTAKQREALRYFNAIAKVRKQASAGAASKCQTHVFDGILTVQVSTAANLDCVSIT